MERHQRIIARLERGERIVARRGVTSRAEQVQIHAGGDFGRVREEPTNVARAVGGVEISRGGVSQPRVRLAHPVPFPRRPPELKRVVHRVRIQTNLRVRALDVERVSVAELRDGKDAHANASAVPERDPRPVGRLAARATLADQIVKRVLVPHVVVRLDASDPRLGDGAGTLRASEPHHPDVHRRVARVEL